MNVNGRMDAKRRDIIYRDLDDEEEEEKEHDEVRRRVETELRRSRGEPAKK
jgi:hypothetical protein